MENKQAYRDFIIQQVANTPTGLTSADVVKRIKKSTNKDTDSAVVCIFCILNKLVKEEILKISPKRSPRGSKIYLINKLP